jgi:L-amino acid N-acyltransferase YncA
VTASPAPPAIRLATPADATALAAIYAPVVAATVVSFEEEPPDAAEMARRVERTLARAPWLVCERAGEVLGYAYAGAHRERAAYRWSVDVSAYVRADARRCGVGRALYASLLAALAAQGFRNAYAGITLPNPASERLHAAVGFTPVGVYRGVGYKLGAWHDVAWFERPLAPRVADPPPPLPLPAVRDSAAFREALLVGVPLLRLG